MRLRITTVPVFKDKIEMQKEVRILWVLALLLAYQDWADSFASRNAVVQNRFGRQFLLKKLDMDPKGYIDAEIVEPDSDSNEPKSPQDSPSLAPKKKSQSEEKEEEKSLLGFVAKSVGRGISKVFGQDEKSKAKKKRRAQVDSAIDQIFEGQQMGIAGSVFKNIAKGIGGLVTEVIAESSGDSQAVRTEILRELRSSSKSTYVLGDQETIQIGPPFQSSSSITSANGKRTRILQYVLPVGGNRGQGQVEVVASVDGEEGDDEAEVLISQMVLSVRGMNPIVVVTRGGPGTGSSGSVIRGGGGADVIDVDIV